MWWELTENPRIVLAYRDRPPDLVGIEIHSVTLQRDGPTLGLVAALPRFSDRPSPRWPAGANATQAELRFSGLRTVSLAGWGTSNIGDLSVAPGAGRGVRFRFDSPGARLEGVADWFDVTRVTGYVKGAAEASYTFDHLTKSNDSAADPT